MGLQLAQEEFQDIPTDPVLLTIVIPCPSERRWYCRSHQSLCHRSHAWHPEGLGPHTGAAWMTREGIALRLAIHSPELCKHMTSLNIVGRIFQPSCSRCPFFLTKVLSSLLMIGCLASCTSSHPFSLSLSLPHSPIALPKSSANDWRTAMGHRRSFLHPTYVVFRLLWLLQKID